MATKFHNPIAGFVTLVLDNATNKEKKVVAYLTKSGVYVAECAKDNVERNSLTLVKSMNNTLSVSTDTEETQLRDSKGRDLTSYSESLLMNLCSHKKYSLLAFRSFFPRELWDDLVIFLGKEVMYTLLGLSNKLDNPNDDEMLYIDAINQIAYNQALKLLLLTNDKKEQKAWAFSYAVSYDLPELPASLPTTKPENKPAK